MYMSLCKTIGQWAETINEDLDSAVLIMCAADQVSSTKLGLQVLFSEREIETMEAYPQVGAFMMECLIMRWLMYWFLSDKRLHPCLERSETALLWRVVDAMPKLVPAKGREVRPSEIALTSHRERSVPSLEG
jgi:hypothetical protein